MLECMGTGESTVGKVLRNFHSLEEEGKGTFANRRRDRRKASHLISTATNSTKFDNLAIV